MGRQSKREQRKLEREANKHLSIEHLALSAKEVLELRHFRVSQFKGLENLLDQVNAHLELIENAEPSIIAAHYKSRKIFYKRLKETLTEIRNSLIQVAAIINLTAEQLRQDKMDDTHAESTLFEAKVLIRRMNGNKLLDKIEAGLIERIENLELITISSSES